ncbi:MAG: hypothetical protein M9909_05800 [Thermomicrobiales bacterium]|nr:hypothetical protein [Thermomicrobiales bacterium]
MADLTPPVEEEDPVVEDDAVGGQISSPSIVNAEDIAAVRELILTLHPAIVPELIVGDSIAALIASVIPAQEAYNRIVANVRVPAGGNPVTVVDVDAMPTYEKIRRGLKTHPSRVP